MEAIEGGVFPVSSSFRPRQWGQQSEEQKLARVLIVKCPAKKRSVCQHRRLTLACWVLKRCKSDRNQHQKSKNNKCNVSYSSCTINDSNLEWSVLFDASMRSSKHACIPGEKRCSTMYSRSLIRQIAIPTIYRGSQRTLNQLRRTDPDVRSNSAWRNYVILGASEAPTCCLASGKRKTKRGWSPGDSLIFSLCTFR